jgi:hypothetical protein
MIDAFDYAKYTLYGGALQLILLFSWLLDAK